MSVRQTPVKIDWSYQGKRDLAAGPGATVAERSLMWAGGSCLLVWLVVNGFADGVRWSWWQWLIAGSIALDIGGGAVANALNSCKRFYHSSAQSHDDAIARLAKRHLLFTVAHAHTVIVAAVFAPQTLWVAAGWYAALIISVLVALATPLYLRRAVATFLVAVAIVAGHIPELMIPYFEWLPALLFLKIVLGHAVREEPYRPV